MPFTHSLAQGKILIYIARIGLHCHIELKFHLLSDTASSCLYKHLYVMKKNLDRSNCNVCYYVNNICNVGVCNKRVTLNFANGQVAPFVAVCAARDFSTA